MTFHFLTGARVTKWQPNARSLARYKHVRTDEPHRTQTAKKDTKQDVEMTR